MCRLMRTDCARCSCRRQMFIGDGAKLVRDAFELAKEKCKDQAKVRTTREDCIVVRERGSGCRRTHSL